MTELERLESIVKQIRRRSDARVYCEHCGSAMHLTRNHATDRRNEITTPESTYSFPAPTHIW